MVLGLKFVVGLIGIYLIAIAGMWMFMPDFMSVQFAVTLDGVQGMSMGRGDMGGLFLTAGILCLLGLRDHESASFYLYAVALLMGTIALGRLIGFVLDGPVLMTFLPFLVELGFVVIMCGLAFLYARQAVMRKERAGDQDADLG